jgi:hypothetical protein
MCRAVTPATTLSVLLTRDWLDGVLDGEGVTWIDGVGVPPCEEKLPGDGVGVSRCEEELPGVRVDVNLRF